MTDQLENQAQNPLVSVLIPAYNVAKYLARCLKSVVNQTYQNLEIVVVDDGSTDQTYAVAKRFADADPRIVLLQKPNENNLAKTRNFLLEHFHGEYCVWVDSDDKLKPRYVEKLYRALIDNHADMSMCEFAIRPFAWPILPPLRQKTVIYEGVDAVPRLIFKGLVGRIALWNKMYRGDWLSGPDCLRFDPALGFWEDLMFNVAYLRRTGRVAHINEKLYAYTCRAGSEMHKKFSHKQVALAETLMAQCESETDPVIRDTLRAWTAVTCCDFVWRANKKQYADFIVRMKQAAYTYRNDLYHHRRASWLFKFIVWFGLKTWCKPPKPKKRKEKLC